MTFRRPRKQDGEAISPDADRWGWRQRCQNISEDREKKDGTADGGAMQKLADGRRSTESSLRRGSVSEGLRTPWSFWTRSPRSTAWCVMRCGVRTLRCSWELFEEFGLDPLYGEEKSSGTNYRQSAQRQK